MTAADYAWPGPPFPPPDDEPRDDLDRVLHPDDLEVTDDGDYDHDGTTR